MLRLAVKISMNSVYNGRKEVGWKTKSLSCVVSTKSQPLITLTYRSAEKWHLWMCQRYMGKCRTVGCQGKSQRVPLFKCRVLILCSPQKDAIFFYVKPSPKGTILRQHWSNKIHASSCIRDTTENPAHHSLNYILMVL